MPSAQTTYPSASTATKYPIPPPASGSDTGASSVEIAVGVINVDGPGVELQSAAVAAGVVA